MQWAGRRCRDFPLEASGWGCWGAAAGSVAMPAVARIAASAWAAMSAEEREAHVQKVRDARGGSRRSAGGRGGGQAPAVEHSSGTDRLPPEVWASMTQEERKAHIARQRRGQRRQRSSTVPSTSAGNSRTSRADASTSSNEKTNQKNVKRRSRRRKKSAPKDEIDPTKSWRFAQYDCVRCNLGESGWCSGNVQALDEPNPSGKAASLPYVVMLNPPMKQLISVPQDSNVCVLPDVCFAP